MKAMARIAARLSLILGALSVSMAHGLEDQRKKYKGKLERGVWDDSWSQTLNQSLEVSSLFNHRETQIEKLCPGYSKQADKRTLFWHQLILSLGWKESLHGPENWVEFRGGRNNGLYQINPVLRTYYDCKDFDLFNPHQNIQCAIKMAKKLVDRFGSFLQGKKGGMAAYWQPLRATNAYNRGNRNFILAFVKEACRTNALFYHSRRENIESYMQMDYAPDLTVNTLDDLGIEPQELEPMELFDFDTGD
jgi:hypothetical protein